MGFLDTINKGKQSHLRKTMIYGTSGIGKSTFVATLGALIIDIENGIDDIDCSSVKAGNYDDVMGIIAEIYELDEFEYPAIAIDSMDWLETLAQAKVCGNAGVAGIEDIGFGKGYLAATAFINDILDGLVAIKKKHNVAVFLLAHSAIRKFSNPSGEDYDQYTPKLHKSSCAKVIEWCDEVFFCAYDVLTKSGDESFGKKKSKAISNGERVMYATEQPWAIAKQRAAFPDKMPLLASEYQKHLEEFQSV